MLEQLALIRPLSLEVSCAHDMTLWPAALRPITTWRRKTIDPGVVQHGELQVDVAATTRSVTSWLERFDRIVAEEAAYLSGTADLVVADVPAPAVEAASAAGIASVAVANFSWDWIYARMGLHEAAERCRQAYAGCGLLLAAAPDAPMDAFERRLDVGTIGRTPKSGRAATRASLSLRDGARVILVALRAPQEFSLPPERKGVVYLLPAGLGRIGGDAQAATGNSARTGPAPARQFATRSDVVVAADDDEFPDLIAASDLVLARPGYGILGDIAAAGARLLYVPRCGFPEDEVLEDWLCDKVWAARTTPGDVRSGDWLRAALELLDAPRAGGGAAVIGAQIAARAIDEYARSAGPGSAGPGSEARKQR